MRTGRGWPGILLLAAAFGVLQAGVIDLSLFLGPQTGVAAFDLAGEATMIGGTVSAAMATTWIGGHVVMSIGTPLALADWFAPGLRGRPWLGRIGICVVAALFVGAAALIHVDQRGDASLDVVVAGGSRCGGGAARRPRLHDAGPSAASHPGRTAPRTAWLVGGAFAGKLTLETLPATWPGVVVAWLLLVAAAVLVARAARAPDWAERQAAALAAGALLAWTVVGFLAPDLPGVEPLHRYLHNAAFAVWPSLSSQPCSADGRSRRWMEVLEGTAPHAVSRDAARPAEPAPGLRARRRARRRAPAA